MLFAYVIKRFSHDMTHMLTCLLHYVEDKILMGNLTHRI